MINKIIEAIKEAESNGLLKKIENVEVTGLSGDKLLGCIQRLVEIFAIEDNTCYLEVGVFQGLTLLHSAIICSSFTCYGVDNFAYFDPEKKNLSIVEDRIKKADLKNVNLINLDYEDALENLEKQIENKKVGVYFIDGPHDYRSQLMCLQLALPYLHEQAVIVIDDCNYRHVRQANRDFLITHPEYKLVFEAYTQCHPNNMTPEHKQKAQKGWWNGVNILTRDVYQRLESMYPPTQRSRQIYENEHIIHASKLAEFAPKALEYFNSMSETNLIKFLIKSRRQYYKLVEFINKNNLEERFKTLNTYSENLLDSNYNQLRR